MTPIGILASRWDRLPGRVVHEPLFYPEFLDYGACLDPPYEVGGHPVRGSGGWVVMGAGDFARLGLLIATGGLWDGKRLISRLGGNAGVGANWTNGWGRGRLLWRSGEGRGDVDRRQ